ncbi:MAG TPA: glycosyltransferase [Candidatus Magasanikbacteria bacterium]|nr:glycosyltransferase [Candidatus Magasanikbacteria bacterium]
MKKIHVVHIIPKLGFGGAERFVVELAKHVSSHTIRQTVITLWDDRPLMGELPDSASCMVFPFDGIGYASRIPRLKKLLTEIEADVVHTHLFSADLWGRLAAHAAKIPVVTTEHNINVGESWLWGTIKRTMKHFSRVYTAPSHAVAAYMKTAYGIALKDTRVIMHGIELEHFTKIKPAAFTEPYQLLMIGRIVEQKGHTIALDALHKLTDISCTLTIVGEGEKKESLMRYAKELGVSDRVIWKSATENVSKEYAAADIVLVPSRWEGLGIVVLEALASERLVIGSRVGGIPEIITDGENGRLIPGENSDALADAIRASVENYLVTKKIAKQGRAWVKERGNVVRMAEAYEALYQEVAKK